MLIIVEYITPSEHKTQYQWLMANHLPKSYIKCLAFGPVPHLGFLGRLSQRLIWIRLNVQRGNGYRSFRSKDILQAQSIRHNLLTLVGHIDSAQLSRTTINESILSKCECEWIIPHAFVKVETSGWFCDCADVL